MVGPRPYRVERIQNSRHVNKGKMHRITIRSALVGTKWGVQELEVDNVMFDSG